MGTTESRSKKPTHDLFAESSNVDETFRLARKLASEEPEYADSLSEEEEDGVATAPTTAVTNEQDVKKEGQGIYDSSGNAEFKGSDTDYETDATFGNIKEPTSPVVGESKNTDSEINDDSLTTEDKILLSFEEDSESKTRGISRESSTNGSTSGSGNESAVKLKGHRLYSLEKKEERKPRGRPSACIFVASLSSGLSDDVLCQSVTSHFAQWGKITLVKVLRDPANRPYAFVQYDTEKEAKTAISEGQHSILNGRTVRCERARVNRTLYLQMNDKGVSAKRLCKFLEAFGEVERMVAVDQNFEALPSQKGPSKNWFAKFVFRQDAISAFANLKTKAAWCIEWAQNLEDEYDDIPDVTIDRFSIFVGHLDPRISRQEVVERFETHGMIKEAILVNRPLNNFAFIKFKEKESAASAVEAENHALFKYQTIHVQYRELYNNYRKKYAGLSSHRLNLAPPPINFRKKYSFGSTDSRPGLRKRSIYPYRDDMARGLGMGSRLAHNALPVGAISQQKSNFRSISGGGLAPNCIVDSPGEIQSYAMSAGGARNSIDDKGRLKRFSFTKVGNSSNASTKIAGLSINPFLPVDEDSSKANGSNAGSPLAANREIYQDSDTIRSNATTCSGSATKSGYTYSTVDGRESMNSELLEEMSQQQYPQPGPYNMPYYYILPTKDMGYMGGQFPTMMPPLKNPPETEEASKGGIRAVSSMASVPRTANSSTSPGYYIPYAGFSQSPGVAPPPMYPYYLYYNNCAPGSSLESNIAVPGDPRVVLHQQQDPQHENQHQQKQQKQKLEGM
ncbi:hypothetical protein FOA43_000541 [Brettanomyces nanus]|uniref:RRM domain-containing protein n=1 Tax=Eeniella nana TaxID=13502 RepID=A0A875S1F0_EENNA|nr:uncharacterized protein FOA43_000541 [Brettanomyces nanus]QPG73234.1 hypothetical protein FOA43_000541 [Brettanomyces nanus]